MKSYLPDHPRPQFARTADRWQNLNGTWRFAFDDDQQGVRAGWPAGLPEGRTITVPFTYETPASGIGDPTPHTCVWYSRTFRPARPVPAGERLLLHFEGCDYQTDVWVNGVHVGSHTGGYTRFSFDITDLLCEGDNVLTVRACDSFDRAQPRGKQRWLPDNFACFYVQTTGIWKTVWLETVPAAHLTSAKLTPHLADQSLEVVCTISDPAPGRWIEAEASFNGHVVCRMRADASRRRVTMTLDICDPAVHHDGVRHWSPKHPDLYDLTLTLSDGTTEDVVYSYFGMREVRTHGANVLLNHGVLYQRLILDQGYWPETGLTPPDEAALIRDIEAIQELGFNGLRKHQKIEDERFYYWCDVKGLLVWCEMPSCYQFCDDMAEAFMTEWTAVVRQYYNHPSIITWTPFNESWGIPAVRGNRAQQHLADAVYHQTHAIDPIRPVISNDGWEHTQTDLITLHDYEEEGDMLRARYADMEQVLSCRQFHNFDHPACADGYAYAGQPVLLTEYGGIAYDSGEGWGYGNRVPDEAALLARLSAITDAVRAIPGCCGFCYTQLTDVQQEVNGLMDMERRYKVDPAAVRAIMTRRPSPRFGNV